MKKLFLILAILIPALSFAQTDRTNNYMYNTPKAADDRTGVFSSGAWRQFTSISEANTKNPISRRALGLTVIVGSSATNFAEYWYYGGIADTCLKVKNAAITIDTTSLSNRINGKVDIVSGKQLSTNDFSTPLLTKLNGIAVGATANSTDAFLRDRANHTGTQAPSTIVQDASNRFVTDAEKTIWNTALTDSPSHRYTGLATASQTVFTPGFYIPIDSSKTTVTRNGLTVYRDVYSQSTSAITFNTGLTLNDKVGITVVGNGFGPGGGGGSGTVTGLSATTNTGQTWNITNPNTTPNINLTLTKVAVGLANVDNTSDASKPVSSSQATAIAAKQDVITLTTNGTSGVATKIGSTINIPNYTSTAGAVPVTFTSNIPFNNLVSTMSTTLSSNMTLKPDTAGAKDGNSALVTIIGSGSNTVGLSGFQKSKGSLPFDFSTGAVNLLSFVRSGGFYWYSNTIADNVGVWVPFAYNGINSGASKVGLNYINNSSAALGNIFNPTKHITVALGGAVRYQKVTDSSRSIQIGLNSTNAEQNYATQHYVCGLGFNPDPSTTISAVLDGTTLNSNVGTLNVGEYVGMFVSTSGVVSIQKSLDGDNWSTLYTFSTASTDVTLYPNSVLGLNGLLTKLYNPEVLNGQ